MKLILGAARTAIHGWVSTDKHNLDVRKADDWAKYGQVEMALAEHVWEHLTEEEGQLAAELCGQYVARIRVAVPDGLYPDEAFRARARLGEVEGDHLSLYDYKSLSAIFEAAGYKVTLLEWWDKAGVFHYRRWDTEFGTVYRSLRFDARNRGGKIGYTSLILDAVKEL